MTYFLSNFVNNLFPVIAISYGLFFPIAFIPKGGFILATILVLFFLIRNIDYKPSKDNSIETAVAKVAIIYLLNILFLIIFNLDKDTSLFSTLSLIMINSMIFLFLADSTHEEREIWVETYVYFSLLISILSLISYFMFVIGFDFETVNLSEITNGAYTRDIELGESYASSFASALILLPPEKILAMDFYRITGYFNEPTNAAFFITPALIISLLRENYSYLRKVIFSSIFMIFLLLCFSVINIFAIMTLILFLIYSKITTSDKLSFNIIAFIFYAIFLSVALRFSGVDFGMNMYEFSSIFNRLDSSSESFLQAWSELTWFLPREVSFYWYFGHTIVWSLIIYLTFKSISAIFTLNTINPYAFVLLYLIIHSMKGMQENLMFMPIFLFFAAIFIYSLTDTEANE